MPDMGTKKKLTKVGGSDAADNGSRSFTPTAESKAKATRNRVIAAVAWLVAIGAEVAAIVMLQRPPISMTWLIVLIAVDLAFAVAGSLLWKAANRLDPASEKEPVRFFVQNQLGLIIAIVAFLPLVVLVFTNKNMDGKQKGIVGGIAAVALVIAGISGIDFNPPSIEQYAEQTARVESLTGGNHVYWTKSGKSYHLYSDCSYINTDRTTEIFEGSVAQARELKNITDLCDRCAGRAEKEKGIDSPAGESEPADSE